MTNRQQILIIARKEFMGRAKSRVFLITMVLISAAVIGGIFLVSIIGGEPEVDALAIGGNSPPGLAEDVLDAAIALDIDVTVADLGSADDASAAVSDESVVAALVDGSIILSNSAPSGTITAVLASAANAAARREVAADLALTDAEITMVVAPVAISVTELDPGDPDADIRAFASFLASMVLLMTIMMFGQFVAMGIVEEKQNRVVEVILAKVRTTSLLIGKVLGIGALGLVQVGAFALSVIIGLRLAPLPDGPGQGLADIGVSAVLWLIFWFILGYLLYSFMYAALGATISRQEDMQSVAFIPAIAIMPAYFLVMVSVESGPSLAVRIGSFFPLWSPILMPFRINVGDVHAWEIVVSVVLVILTIALLIRIGARVYRGAALSTGARVSLKDAWQNAASR